MSRVLYRGATVYAPGPPATALLVEGSQIGWMGSDAAAAGFTGVDAVIDLEGAWVAPAFVDAHVHVVAAGLALGGLDLTEAPSLTAALDLVRQAASQADPQALIWGTGWDETAWPAPRRAPTPAELDRAAGGRSVYLARADVHSAAASPALLRAAGVPVHDVPVCADAHHAVRRVARGLLTSGQRQSAAELALRTAAGLGIGMVHECSGPEISDAGELAIVKAAARATGIDVVAYWAQLGTAGVKQAAALEAEPGGDLFVDGSLGSHTAALTGRYADDPGRGVRFLTPREIGAHLIAAASADAQAGFHVIGDAAVANVIEGLGMAEAELGLAELRRGRHRVEHLELCSAEQLEALARYGVVASMQPAFDARWGGPDGMYVTRLGPERAAGMNDFAALQAAGIPLAFGSDAPVTPMDPWGAIRAAMDPASRRKDGGSKALSERAAFTCHTRGGHRAARRDGGGMLQPGSEATFAVWTGCGELAVRPSDGRLSAWSTDPKSGAPGLPDLRDATPKCAGTVVRGRTVFGLEGAAG